MDNFDLRKFLAENRLNENFPKSKVGDDEYGYTELTDDEKEITSAILDNLQSKINPELDIAKQRSLIDFVIAVLQENY